MRATLRLVVKPNAKETVFTRDAERTLVLRVRERAIDGAANQACEREIATALDVAPSSVRLIRGHRGRVKTFEIAGLTDRQVIERLGEASRGV